MSLLQHLQNIPDPRVQRTRRHELQSILVVALCATIAGADNCVEMAEFGQQHQDWFERLVPLPSGIASHDTFARVFRLLDAKELERACQQWLAQVAGRVHGTVAIDGKSVRGSSKADARRPLHMVSAWAADMGLLLGQCKVDGKSNEITAIPELLRLLHLKGCIVTIDAIGCQKSIAQQLHEHGADYVLSLKGNQRHMHAVVLNTLKCRIAKSGSRRTPIPRAAAGTGARNYAATGSALCPRRYSEQQPIGRG